VNRKREEFFTLIETFGNGQRAGSQVGSELGGEGAGRGGGVVGVSVLVGVG